MLGVTVPGGGAAGRPLLPLWLDAKDEVDSKVGRLQGSLRGVGDPDLDRIAEFGLNGVTGTSSVGLMVALREADARASQKLAGAIDSCRAFLDGSEVVKLIDDNPRSASCSGCGPRSAVRSMPSPAAWPHRRRYKTCPDRRRRPSPF